MAISKKKKSSSAIYAAFIVAMAALGSSVPVGERGIDSGAQAASLGQPALALNARPDGISQAENSRYSASNIISFVMNKLEGPGFVPNDNGHGPSRWGILGLEEGLTYQQTKDLTAGQAASIYKRRYWDAIEADSLPPHMRLMAFNAAMHFGLDKARHMIAEARGNPQALLQASIEFCEYLAKSNPARYGASMNGWRIRYALLGRHIGRELPVLTNVASLQSPPLLTVRDAAEAVQTTPSIEKARVSHAGNDQDQAQTLSWGIAPLATLGLLAGGWRLRLRRRRAQNIRTPSLSKPKRGHSQNDDDLRPDRHPPAKAPAPDDQFPSFSKTELEAFFKIYWRYAPQPLEERKKWRVDYGHNAHVVVGGHSLELHGDGGIEDSLRYASLAWGNRIQLSGGTAAYREQIKIATQKLVDEGALPPHFTIVGLGSFRPPLRRPQRQNLRPRVRGLALQT